MKKTLSAIFLALAAGAVQAQDVAYPAGYRHWTHVKSMILEAGHPLYASFGGIHHVYANKQALAGYRTGQFPEGAVIVFDLLEAAQGSNAVTEGPRKVLGVMERNARKYKDTGGWGFEGFAGGDRARRVVGKEAKGACFGCHAEQAGKTGYVFSTWRE